MLYNTFLKNIMKETHENIHSSIFIREWPISSLRFAHNIDQSVKNSKVEQLDLTNRLEKELGGYRMETLRAGKSKIQKDLVEWVMFKYLGTTLTKDIKSQKIARHSLDSTAMMKLDIV